MTTPKPSHRRRAVAFCALALAALCLAPAAPATSDDSSARVAAAKTLLLHRIDAIYAATPRGKFPLGAASDGTLYFAKGWTTGFWPGALWHSYDLTGDTRLRARALRATERHFGFERTPIHDLGFMYAESSVAAYQRLCPGRASRPTCARLRRSGLIAASTLARVAATGKATRMIPTTDRGCPDCGTRSESSTIIDSMMNLRLLYWAGEMTGRRIYDRIARAHATRVASLLVRPDGSTSQAVRLDRRSGQVLATYTRQGLSDTSTWSRGQAWAVYGFADAGRHFHSPAYLAVAERSAEYVAEHLPAGGVPLWDYDAPPGSQVDVSAGVITASGLFHLDAACRAVPGACRHPGVWAPLAKRMLAAALEHTSTVAPLGMLGDQVYTMGGRHSWDDVSEMIFGLHYALEGLTLARR